MTSYSRKQQKLRYSKICTYTVYSAAANTLDSIVSTLGGGREVEYIIPPVPPDNATALFSCSITIICWCFILLLLLLYLLLLLPKLSHCPLTLLPAVQDVYGHVLVHLAECVVPVISFDSLYW